jgi:hypothetical protein
LTTIAEGKIKLEKPKIDERLEYVNISKGLVESLNDAGFTIEIILNNKPSDIAKVLGIDDYVANIIYHETKHYYQMNYEEEFLV